jgi:hypothetical protein
MQGCQIFVSTPYQNGKIIPNSHKIYQIAVNRPNGNIFNIHNNIFHYKTLQNIPKLGFWFEIMASGNPVHNSVQSIQAQQFIINNFVSKLGLHGQRKSLFALAQWSSHPPEKQKIWVRIPPVCNVFR